MASYGQIFGPPVLASLTNSLSGNVAMNNISNYFPGPTVAQGTVGTWFASGSVTFLDSAGAANFSVKLWDGTTVIDSAQVSITAAGKDGVATVSGFITNPAGNIRIDVKDTTSTSGVISFNDSGNSKDSTLTVLRIG